MNTTPTVAIPRHSPADDPAIIAASVQQHGCAVVERLAPTAACDEVLAELAPFIADTPTGEDSFSGHSTRRTGALLARSDAAVGFIAHPTVLDVADRVLWQPKSSFQLHLTQVISMDPGSQRQELHRDHWCFDFFPIPADIDVELSTMWALTDFTEENGATNVVVDSHRTTGMPFTAGDAVPAAMPKGSVLLYVGGTVHGGGANSSDRVRRGLNVDCALSFLRQEENQYLSVPLERVRALPAPVQDLMGYRLGAFALGYVDDVRDPATLLESEPGRTSSFAPR